MPRKHYGWQPGRVPEISCHSLAKHRILREYIEAYVRVLTYNPRIDRFRLTLVDGFAGGGEYVGQGSSVIYPGSPQILLDAVRAAEAMVNAGRQKPLKVLSSFYFVEKEAATARYLRSVLEKRNTWKIEAPTVRIIEGQFEAHIEAILTDICATGRAKRTIFALDQYGYSDVQVPILGRIFEVLPNAEVFLTLAVGWIVAYLPTARAAAEKLGIDAETFQRLSRYDEDQIASTSQPTRRLDLRAIQRILHHVFTEEIRSRFYTPFFIVSRESNRAYWFLHIANSARAHDVVKELHWKVQNHFEHFGAPGLTMLGYDPQEDPAHTGQTRFIFDDPARARTRLALARAIPSRISERFVRGVAMRDLFQGVCNETPATLSILSEAVRDLCVAGELSKKGGRGERRDPATLPRKDDLIELPRQRSFHFLRTGHR